MWQDEEIRDERALNTKRRILVTAKNGASFTVFGIYLCKIVSYEKVRSDS